MEKKKRIGMPIAVITTALIVFYLLSYGPLMYASYRMGSDIPRWLSKTVFKVYRPHALARRRSYLYRKYINWWTKDYFDIYEINPKKFKNPEYDPELRRQIKEAGKS